MNLCFEKSKIIALSIFLLFCCCKSWSQENKYNYALGFKTDNDAYLGIRQDRYYTNGLFVYFKKNLNSRQKDTSAIYKKNVGFELGQKMYNARSGNISQIERVDRPFAAYLYAATSMQWVYNNETNLKAELQIGTIGPRALGKEAQELIHKTFGFYNINGWQYQVNNEMGINLGIEYQKLVIRSSNKNFDLALPLSLNIGNTFTTLKSALLFRVGNLNPYYHSVANFNNFGNYKNQDVWNAKEWFFYYRPSLNVIGYDGTIQGGLFNKQKGPKVFDPKPLVLSNEIGFSCTNQKWNANLGLFFNTKEVKSSAMPHKYASLTFFRYF